MTAEALNNLVRRLSKKLDPDGRILRINGIMGSADYMSMNGSCVLASGLDGVVDDRSDRGDPLIGRVLDNKYEIIKAIGGGASGQVYKAKHQDAEYYGGCESLSAATKYSAGLGQAF
jgi:hypothetical protein